MANKTKIEWTHRKHPLTGIMYPGYTRNYWLGCTMIAPECAGCYAAAQDAFRFSKMPAMGGSNEKPVSHWGKGAPRHRTSADYWKECYAFNREALKLGMPLAVFTNSLADFFDQEVDPQWRYDALQVIHQTPHLDWLILTKRPEKIWDNLAAACYTEDKSKNAEAFFYWLFNWTGSTAQNTEQAPANVWLGTTVGISTSLHRAEELIKVPARVRFLSMEPLLDDVAADPRFEAVLATGKIHWVIVGGESESPTLNQKARPMNPIWAGNILVLCEKYGIPFFFKQWGEWAPLGEVADAQAEAMCRLDKVEKQIFPDGVTVYKVGKKNAGKTLCGEVWQAMPKLRTLDT